jgi:hypothetical protein
VLSSFPERKASASPPVIIERVIPHPLVRQQKSKKGCTGIRRQGGVGPPLGPPGGGQKRGKEEERRKKEEKGGEKGGEKERGEKGRGFLDQRRFFSRF